MQGLNRLTIKRRTTVLLLFIFGFYGVLIGRLFFIQVVKAGFFQELAEEQRLREVPIDSKRGMILDRKLRPLAISFDADCIYALPPQIKNAEETAKTVAEILGLPRERVYHLITKNSSFEWIKRKATPSEVQTILESRLPGIEVSQKAQRYFPQGSLAGSIIGIAGIDNQGLEGIEKFYDVTLRGVPGSEQAEFDSKGQHIPLGARRYIPPKDGQSIVLTIDDHIQHIAEREIEKAVLEQGAQRGTVVVMDPMSGEVLALANYPSFDPNHYNDYPSANRRNWPLTDQYEPGSTFKIVTAAAALEEGVVRRDSVFFDPGFIIVEDRRLRCWRAGGHGSQTFVEATENSCNPVFATIALRLGKDKFYEYLDKFGFGRQTNIDFPGEGVGIVPPPSRVKSVELATMGFGQGISVTPMQLLRALCAIANGGYLLEPRLVKEIRTPDGELIRKFEKRVTTQVISERTSAELKEILESVVVNGAGNRAQILGYSVAGKTGTAQKPVGGIYGQGRIASFIGFTPVDDPKLAMLVILDEPQAQVKYGGVIAAPVFAAVGRDALHYLGVPPKVNEAGELYNSESAYKVVPNILRLTKEEAKSILKPLGFSWREIGKGEYIMEQNPKAGAFVPPNTTILLYLDAEAKYNGNESTVLVPDLTGLSTQKAVEVLESLGLKMMSNGEGLAVEQIPPPGARLAPGMTVSVYFTPTSEE